MSYVITVWNYKSESSYTFGPFEHQEALSVFDKKVWENTDYDYDSISASVVNSPTLFGTGNEMS